jgi:hypothetical protein
MSNIDTAEVAQCKRSKKWNLTYEEECEVLDTYSKKFKKYFYDSVEKTAYSKFYDDWFGDIYDGHPLKDEYEEIEPLALRDSINKDVDDKMPIIDILDKYCVEHNKLYGWSEEVAQSLPEGWVDLPPSPY